MAQDFKSPGGSFGPASSREPKSSGKPSAGITNDSKGNRAPAGPGPGTGANPSRIS